MKESGGISVLENGTLNSFCPHHIFGYFTPSKKRKKGEFLEFLVWLLNYTKNNVTMYNQGH